MSGDISALAGRPRFHEGQYLSADDLAAIVDYLRGAEARHALAAHTPGIVVGLDLLERNAAGAANRREVILQPGLAWDGFGRLIVANQPTRLQETLFASIPYAPAVDEPGPTGAAPTGRLVKVWLAYRETAAGSPAPGFESCASDDQSSRVLEGFDFVIGDFASGPQQRDNVIIGTESLEPQNALKAFDAAAATLFDASVPHQTFPTNARQRWLMPVGYVRWIARSGDLGYFVQRDLLATDNVADRIRAARQYVGLVGEYLHAADGHVVLHDRRQDPLGPNKFASLVSSGNDTAEHASNLAWVEGNLRVGGDAKIAGGKLQLRDVAGLDQGTLLYISRSGDGAAGAGKRDLNAAIGPGAQKDNRFVVGPHDAAGVITPQLAVVSVGRVGVNTGTPVATLHVDGPWDGTENGALRLAGDKPTIRFGQTSAHLNEQWIVQADDSGNLQFSHRTGMPEPVPGTWKPAVFLTPTLTGVPGTTEPGVGIRSDHPRNPLAIRATGPWEELVSFEDPGGVTKWHINQKANATTPGLNFCETAVSDARLFLKAGGDVGVGTVAPTNKLHVDGNTGIRQNRLYLSGGVAGSSVTFNAHRDNANATWVFPDPTHKAVTLEMDDSGGASRFAVWSTGTPSNTVWRQHFRINGDSDSVVMAWNGGNVGIGTQSPQQKLHVAGSYIRVDGAGNEQAYIGGDGVANDVQVGSMINGVQNVALYNPASNSRMNLYCQNIDAGFIVATRVTGQLINTSDQRLKEKIAAIKEPLALLKQLRGVSFRWKSERQKGEADFGVIAQEVQKVLPELVHEGGGHLGVAYSSLIPILIESVKELAGEVERLHEELVELRRKAKSDKDERREEKSHKGEKTHKGEK
jgi:hypothetical protein